MDHLCPTQWATQAHSVSRYIWSIKRPMAKDDHQMRIRIPRNVHASLEEEARQRSVSINALVLERLEVKTTTSDKDGLFIQLARSQIALLVSHIRHLSSTIKLLLISQSSQNIVLDENLVVDIKQSSADSMTAAAEADTYWQLESNDKMAIALKNAINSASPEPNIPAHRRANALAKIQTQG